MAKIFGFDGSYTGLSESEAWERIYEHGKNLMPIKEHNLQKKYNKMFNVKTKTIRDDKLKKINTEKLVPGDIIVIDSGDVVPADGKVLESDKLELNNDYLPEDESLRLNGEDKTIVYQGAKVISGKAVVEIMKSGEATFLGSIIKQIDRKNIYKTSFISKFHRNINIIGLLGIVLLIFGAIFSFVTTQGDIISRLSTASYSGLLLFLTTLPIGSCIMGFIKIIEQTEISKKSNIIVKNTETLLKAAKTSVVCIDERFLTQNYEKYVQRFYKAGIRVAVISNKGESELRKLVKSSGIFTDDAVAVSGLQFNSKNEEEKNKIICDAIIFYEMSNRQKSEVIERFEKLGIKTIVIADNISDLVAVENSNLGICTHSEKNSLEYSFSDARIKGFSFSSIYSMIKGGLIVRNHINQYSKYFLIFHLPIILNLLVALLAGINLKDFYFQTLMMVCIIIPLLLFLLNSDYSDDELIKLKENDKKFVIERIKCAALGFIIAVFNIFVFGLLNNIGFGTLFSVNCILILMSIIYALIIFLSRKKIKKQDVVRNVVKSKKENSQKIIQDKKPKERVRKVREDRKKKYDDMKDNIL